jgi:hypothetical protein
MNSIVELIQLIRKRPAMYLGRRSISCLQAFIEGWFLRNPKDVADGEIMNEFQDWIEKKYKTSTTHSWRSIILFYSQDENEALENFFKDFEEFMNRNSQIAQNDQLIHHKSVPIDHQ